MVYGITTIFCERQEAESRYGELFGYPRCLKVQKSSALDQTSGLLSPFIFINFMLLSEGKLILNQSINNGTVSGHTKRWLKEITEYLFRIKLH